MLEKPTQEILLLDFDFTYFERHNFLTLTSCSGKFNQEDMYQTLSESASFGKSLKDTTKTF